MLGVPTNLPLLRRIAGHPSFAAGDTTIDFLDRHRLSESPEDSRVPEEAVLLAAAGDLYRAHVSVGSLDPFAAGPWRPGGHARMRYAAGGATYQVEAARVGARGYSLRLGEREAGVEVLSLREARLSAVVDGGAVTCGFVASGEGFEVSLGGVGYFIGRASPPRVDALAGASGGASLTAPMPGTVARVLVGEGDEVREGQTLLVLEAMKMEQPVAAPHAGKVLSMPFPEGSLVPGGVVLAEVEESAEPA